MSEEKTFLKNTALGACGIGAMVAQIDVKDGKLIRTRPMPYGRDYSEEHMRPWVIKAKGSEFHPAKKSDIVPFSVAYKKRAYSPNRIPYPLKREDWDPKGNRNPQNRGVSKFVRISWDEATDLIADEVRRIHATYGPYGIMCEGDGHGETKVLHACHSCQMALFAKMGGFTYQARNADSWEGWYWGAKHVWGGGTTGQGNMGNTLVDIAQNAEMVLFWGCDMETTTWGWHGFLPSRYCFWLTEIGVKQVYICPDVNYGCAVHADKWIPVLPNTDSALQCAVIHTWLKEGLWNQEYIETHSVGFDWVKSHIMGWDDGVEKTPEWAAPLCGVPSRTIKALAREWYYSPTSIAHCNGGSYIRSTYSHEPARFEVVMLAMQGMGAPGRHFIKFIEWNLFGRPETSAGPAPALNPQFGAAYRGFNANKSQTYNFRTGFIPKTLIHKALLGDYDVDHPLTWYGTTSNGWPREDQFNMYRYPTKKAGTTVHMIWTDCPCWSTCWNGGNSFVEALRQPAIECIVAQHPWLENDCLYADIILPTNTGYETNDMSIDLHNGNWVMAFLEKQCIEPLYESKSDWEAVAEVAKKLGMYEEFSEGLTEEEWIKRGFDGSGLADVISYEEFCEKENYCVPTAENWEDNPRGYAPFYEDPKANPLNTPTGLLEFYSETLAANFPDDEERKPYPHYISIGESHQESLQHPRAKKYPFLMESNHPRWRVHAQLDDVPWIREIETCKMYGPDGYQYEPAWINPKDAEEYGIKHGDIIRIFNDRGWTMGAAYVTERIRTGVILQDHGARVDPIQVGKSDRAGANNLICPTTITSKNCAGEVTSGFLVGIEKADLDALAKAYPEAFNRKLDEGVGVSLSNWIRDME